jgi:hypothetical protein
MSGACSNVLGKDVMSGSIGVDKIDGATGLHLQLFCLNIAKTSIDLMDLMM